jgi:hypothetical protein
MNGGGRRPESRGNGFDARYFWPWYFWMFEHFQITFEQYAISNSEEDALWGSHRFFSAFPEQRE